MPHIYVCRYFLKKIPPRPHHTAGNSRSSPTHKLYVCTCNYLTWKSKCRSSRLVHAYLGLDFKVCHGLGFFSNDTRNRCARLNYLYMYIYIIINTGTPFIPLAYTCISMYPPKVSFTTLTNIRRSQRLSYNRSPNDKSGGSACSLAAIWWLLFQSVSRSIYE